jgi:DNA repair protein RecO (recombination protein O)
MPSRERSFRVEAVVLRHSDWGEADRILTLFTLEQGKLRAIAKGARKARSRKAGHLEPFMRSSLLLARGRDLLIVTQAETIDAHQPVRDDLLLSTHAYYVVELLDRFTYEEGENPALYRLLADTLARLSTGAPLSTGARLSTGANPDLVARYYEVRLLDLVGFRPQLFNCVSCSAEILPQDQFFSAERGGVLCPKCGKGSGAWPVSMQALKYLRHFQRSSYGQVAQVPFSPELNSQIENLAQHYLTYLLERGLNTPAFLRRVKKGPLEAENS